MTISALQALALCSLLGLSLDPCGSGDPPRADATGDVMPCSGVSYPCGPYGTGSGDVAADATFSAYLDPGHLCKANTAMKMDLSALSPVSFSRWHQGGAACAGKRRSLLWVSLSAGWCPSCANEVSKLQARYQQGKLDPRVAVLDVVLETKTKGQPATAAFLEIWIKASDLTFPVALDSSAAMTRYFSAKDLPAAMLLDLQTMKIVYKATGAQVSNVEQAADSYLK